jgi:aminopeptidase N
VLVSSFKSLRSAWWAALSCALTAWLLAGVTAPALWAQAAPLTGPGVSAALAQRRAQQLIDVAYDLALSVSSGDTATGRVTVSFTKRAPGDVVLDFRGLSVRDGRINGAAWPTATAAWNRHHLVIPGARLRAGRNHVEVMFATPIAQAGASIIRHRDVADGRVYLYTLLVPSDANLLFPCFDQPDLKAKVRLSLTTPADWHALANGALLTADTAGTLVTHRFRETQRLSTYLIAFAAGPWARETRAVATSTAATPVPVSLWMRQSRRAEAESDTLIAMNARALRWLGDWFGIPYPFDKYDALLAPAFPFGGMEHPGAVFYNEESFIFRERPTVSQLLGRQATTFHEVAHQWFGDYLTMRWFDDLWLKEGFATYMAARMQADLEPDANAWKTFYLRNKPVAYATDATAGTTPIWQQLANLDQAKSNYGPIVYNKAPGVLKQLEYLVGASAFQRGVRAFLRTHAYGNGTWRELLRSVGTAAGRDLTTWGKAWMLRPGMPLVEQGLTVRNGVITRLTLVQRAAQPSLSGRGAWPLKVQLLLYYANRPAVRLPVEMRGDTTVVTAAAGRPAPDFVFANDGDYGYAIVLPDSMSVQWLERQLSDVPDDFLRAMLWGSLWDLVRDAQLSPTRYAEMVLRALPRERDEQITGTLVGRLATVIGRYTDRATGDALLARAEPLLLRGAADSTLSYGQRKSQLDAVIGLARTPASLAALDVWLDRDSIVGLPLRPPTRWAIVTRLTATGSATAAARLATEARRDSSSEGQRQAFVADAARPDSAHKRALFTRWFSDASLNEEWVTSSLRSFHDTDQAALTQPYLVPALDTLPWIQQHRRIFFLGSWLGATISGQRDAAALATIDGWLATHAALAPDLRQKIRQSRDELERTVRIRRTFDGAPEQR